MALTKCPECGKERVSSTAWQCPECGFNLREYFESNPIFENVDLLDEDNKENEIKNETEKDSDISSKDNKRNVSSKKVFLGCAFAVFFVILLICLNNILNRDNEKKQKVSYAINSVQTNEEKIEDEILESDAEEEKKYEKKEAKYNAMTYNFKDGVLFTDSKEDLERLINNHFLEDDISYEENEDLLEQYWEEGKIGRLYGNIRLKVVRIDGEYVLVQIVDNGLSDYSFYKKNRWVSKGEIEIFKGAEGCQYEGCEEVGTKKIGELPYCSEHYDEIKLSEEKSEGGKVKVLSFEVEKSYGNVHVTGSVRNTTPNTVYFVKVRIDAIKDGEVVDTSSTYAIGDEGLRPDSSVQFECYMNLIDGAQYSASVYDYDL